MNDQVSRGAGSTAPEHDRAEQLDRASAVEHAGLTGPPATALLELRDLHVELRPAHRGGEARTVIHDVSLIIGQGQSLGLVGESGSGKSMTTRAILRMLPSGATTRGSLTFEGASITDMDRRQLAEFRASSIGMIYQDPRAHTNPLRTVGDFIIEGVVTSGRMRRPEAEQLARQLLEDVGISDAGRRLRQYPHQLSGGMLQRVMIVSALMGSPRLILADEPTTALDVTVQSEVMAILAESTAERGSGVLFITHDLDLAAAVTDRIAVMYAGVVVETGASEVTCERPMHPYTAGLLASRPARDRVQRPLAIPGRPLSAFEAGPGCVFASRCPLAVDRCRTERPELRHLEGRAVACHRADELAGDLAATLEAAL